MDKKYLIALNSHQKIGSQTLKKILAIYNNPEDLWQENEAKLIQNLGEKIANFVLETRQDIDPDKEVVKLQKYDVGYITIYDKDYPQLLKEIHDCPVILYIRGNVEALSLSGIGVVGSRKYTNYGKKISYNLSKECAQAGLCIVSGLALGIDAFAHEAAIDADGKTVGVLGHGLDKIYPVSNFQLAKRIIDKGGAIISEFPLGVPPMKQHFPARNRIIAGLSLGTLVIEAAEKSGALITAYQSLDYNREVFAIPGNIDNENSVGTNKLIQAGAKLVMSCDDILKELNIEKKEASVKAREAFIENEDEKKVMAILQKGECLVDQIVLLSELNIVAINSSLTTLEMKGLVENLGGGRYKRL